MSNELDEANRLISKFVGHNVLKCYDPSLGLYTDSLDALQGPIEKFCKENDCWFNLNYEDGLWVCLFEGNLGQGCDPFASIAAAKCLAQALEEKR